MIMVICFQESVIGIIDGIGGRESEIIQALCDMMELPHVLIKHDVFNTHNWSLLNMYPSPVAYNMVRYKNIAAMGRYLSTTCLSAVFLMTR
jgi:hypothetical protein